MKKKWLLAGGGMALGVVMLVAGGLSAMADSNGYEAYKTALFQTKAVKSMTGEAKLTVIDNGKELAAGTAVIKLNHELDAMSVSAALNTVGGAQHEANVYRQDGRMIVKTGDDDVYHVMEAAAAKWRQDGEHPNPPKAVQQVFEALMGNLKELATVTGDADGGKRASLHLTGSQIPAVANVLGSLAIGKAASGDGIHSRQLPELPKLTDNIRIESVNLDADINPDQTLKRQTAEIGISGTDESGLVHALAIRLQIDFSGYDTTEPERIDLTGKKTEVVRKDDESGKRGWHH